MNQPINAFFFRDFKNSYIPDILEEVYMKKIYEPYLITKKDLVIADFGANIGLTAYYFKDYAKTVYAVEPSNNHFEELSKMIEFNKIDNIVACKYAISNKDGKTRFYHNDNSTMYSLSNVVNGDKDYEEVETVTMDTFMKRNKLNHIDFLKLDVEGFECEILASDEFKKWSPKIDVICGEWHNWAKCDQGQFANMFKDLGYDFRWLRNTKAACFTAVRI